MMAHEQRDKNPWRYRGRKRVGAGQEIVRWRTAVTMIAVERCKGRRQKKHPVSKKDNF